jgi:glycosyltransferase involved in cell wall biosynthesis
MKEISIIIPVHNNEKSLIPLYSGIKKNVKVFKNYNLIFIDDCSTDDSLKNIKKIKLKDKNIKIIQNNLRLGQVGSIIKGVMLSDAKYYFIISADLQDEPSLIKDFYFKIKKKKRIQIFLFCKRNLQGTFSRKIFSYIYWKMIKFLTLGESPKYGSDVIGFSKIIKQDIIKYINKDDFLSIELIKSNYEKEIIYFDKKERIHGKSSYDYIRLFKLGFISLSSFDLVSIILLGSASIFLILTFFIFGIYVVTDFFISAEKNYTGWRSIILLNLFCFGLIFLNFGYINSVVRKINYKLEK